MKTADLYIRVSTDEQADKGYSQRSQEEVLKRYCAIKEISIRSVIFEDHSAKSFNRPEWQKLLITLKKKRGHTDLILFTKWDRFSRNAGDAYQMINSLTNLGVEPQAIEQPLDITIPENKLMLAIYLAQPEVENDRRALNTFFGMRRARKEGRWMGQALTGYVNKADEKGNKYICPNEPEASIMKWVFEQLATGKWYIDQIWRAAHDKGLRCGRKNFRNIIRNPVYCGKIFIPKYKDEDEHLVQGQHEALVSESLFNEVIDVLDGRKKTNKTKINSPDELPLRGFLICPKCGYMLTGSASKGSTKYYHYYHCFSKCGIRFSAQVVNEKFEEQIGRFTVNPAHIEIYTEIIKELYEKSTFQEKSETSLFKRQITKYSNKIIKARELLISGALDAADYRIVKNESERQITILEGKLMNAPSQERGLAPLLSQAAKNLSIIRERYQRADINEKRIMISSMYPENLIFDGSQHRTIRMNEAIRVFDSLKGVFDSKKKGKSGINLDLPTKVTPRRIELRTH